MSFKFGKLEVRLTGSWSGVQWDEDPAFKEGIGRLRDTAALDLVAVRARDTAVYVEVKDYRGHAVDHESELSNDSLSHWVARKVRDTLAGLLGRLARSKPQPTWKDFALAPGIANNIVVIFWVECSPGWARKKESKVLLSVLTNRLQKDLKWLTPKVHVVAQASDNPLQGEGITFIAN